MQAEESDSLNRAASPSIRRAVLWLQVTVNLLMLGTFLYFFLTSWRYTLHEATERLTRDAVTTSMLARTTLTDASKILDVVREELEAKGELTPRQAHDVLQKAVHRFSIYTTSETMGLLLCLDPSGRLLSRSGEFPSPLLDLSDRGYFLDLRNHPEKRFSLGQLRVAKTTGKRVFHLAQPVHLRSGEFSGVIAIQIDERQFTEMLLPMLDSLENRITVLTDEGRELYRYPSPETPPPVSDPVDPELQKGRGQRGKRPWFEIPSCTASAGRHLYVGYHDDPLLPIRSTARTDVSTVMHLFLGRNIIPLAFSIVALAIVNVLFSILYWQTRNLNRALFASLVDHVTLIGNRRAMDFEFDRLARDVGRRGGSISLLFMDIDRFKSFNDNYGHEAGDRVLREIAAIIKEGMKRPLDFCCRWGGEEFMAVLPETELADALIVAENIRRDLRSLTISTKEGQPLPRMTLSIGISSTRVVRETTLERLVVEADKAMLRAKLAGRDCVVMADTILDSDSPTHPGSKKRE